MKNKCVICGLEQELEREGHVIDGTWEEDALIPKEYWGKWVCSLSCYKRLLDRVKGKEFDDNAVIEIAQDIVNNTKGITFFDVNLIDRESFLNALETMSMIFNVGRTQDFVFERGGTLFYFGKLGVDILIIKMVVDGDTDEAIKKIVDAVKKKDPIGR
ncbi:MAG: hypothetical protein JHC30_07240 [Caldisericum sp.]|jgi:hypothetical protein|nr:hypothetical protein [Caldisericum sp.]